MTNEQKALRLAQDRNRLKERLLEARSLLEGEWKEEFRRYTFDYGNLRLVSADGTKYLQWVLRYRPNAPEEEYNQQTSQGRVITGRIAPWEERVWRMVHEYFGLPVNKQEVRTDVTMFYVMTPTGRQVCALEVASRKRLHVEVKGVWLKTLVADIESSA